MPCAAWQAPGTLPFHLAQPSRVPGAQQQSSCSIRRCNTTHLASTSGPTICKVGRTRHIPLWPPACAIDATALPATSGAAQQQVDDEPGKQQHEHQAASPGCDKLLRDLCASGMFRAAWSVYMAQPQTRSSLRYNTYHTMCITAIEAAEVQAALSIFRDLEASGLQPNQMTVCALVSALCKQRRRGLPSQEIAYQLWKELEAREAVLDRVALRTGINICVASGRLPEAEALLQRMSDEGLPPDTRGWNMLLKGHARSAGVGRAQAAFEAMQAAGAAPSAATYATMVDAHVRAGSLSAASQVLTLAEDAGMTLDVWSYSALINGYVQGSDVGRAQQELARMRQRGIKPNQVTYTTVINGFVRAGDVEGARRVLRQMQAAGVKPNLVTYNTLLRGVAANRKVTMKAALDLLHEMGEAGVQPSADSFNTLMAASLQRHDPAAVPRLFQRMTQAGHSPDALSCTSLITALCELQQPDKALEVFQDLLASPGLRLDLIAYNALVDGLAKAGRMELAEHYAEEAASFAEAHGLALPVEAYGALVLGYGRQRAVESALTVLRKFWERGGVPDDPMFNQVVDLCVGSGEFKRALQVVRAMERIGRPADKARVKAMLAKFYAREKHMQGQQRSRRRPKQQNEALERFKFWLGLPNRYYSSD